jgi:hypothetical protein
MPDAWLAPCGSWWPPSATRTGPRALLLGSGFAVLFACGLVVALLQQMSSQQMGQHMQHWVWAVTLALFAAAVILLLKGRRDAARAADGYPRGRHASPDPPSSRRRWPGAGGGPS